VWENHRDTQSYENSKISKIFQFTFVNSYICMFFLAFWDRSVTQLATMLMAMLVVKQIGLNIAEYLTYSVWINHKIKKAVRPYYDELLKIEFPNSDWALKKRGKCGCKPTKPKLKPDQLF